MTRHNGTCNCCNLRVVIERDIKGDYCSECGSCNVRRDPVRDDADEWRNRRRDDSVEKVEGKR